MTVRRRPPPPLSSSSLLSSSSPPTQCSSPELEILSTRRLSGVYFRHHHTPVVWHLAIGLELTIKFLSIFFLSIIWFAITYDSTFVFGSPPLR
jgi:hypothetical protein